MAKSVKATPLKMRRILVNPSEPPKALNRIFWTRVGQEIVIEAGHFDIVDLRTAVRTPRESGDSPVELDFYITDRFVLTPNAVKDIYDVWQELVADLVDNKMLIPDAISNVAKQTKDKH